jgi:hypothetical protein
MKDHEENKESHFKEKEKESSPLFSIDIQLDENNTKKFEINNFDELDEKLNNFCEKNNIPESAKKYIHDSITTKMNQYKNGCKYIFYIYFSRKYISKKE